MSIENPQLNYLRNPVFINFGSEMFSSTLRLPVLGAMLELTPNLEDDMFYARQIITVLDTDPGNTIREIQRAERLTMICKLPILKDEPRKVFYARTSSSRWNIVRASIDSAKTELGIDIE